MRVRPRSQTVTVGWILACLLMAFIGFEVRSVMAVFDSPAAPRPAPGHPEVALPNPPRPTINYPELCVGLVAMDRDPALRLTDDQRKKVRDVLTEIEHNAMMLHRDEESIVTYLDPRQTAYLKDNQESLRRDSLTPGQPPLAAALRHFQVDSRR